MKPKFSAARRAHFKTVTEPIPFERPEKDQSVEVTGPASREGVERTRARQAELNGDRGEGARKLLPPEAFTPYPEGTTPCLTHVEVTPREPGPTPTDTVQCINCRTIHEIPAGYIGNSPIVGRSPVAFNCDYCSVGSTYKCQTPHRVLKVGNREINQPLAPAADTRRLTPVDAKSVECKRSTRIMVQREQISLHIAYPCQCGKGERTQHRLSPIAYKLRDG